MPSLCRPPEVAPKPEMILPFTGHWKKPPARPVGWGILATAAGGLLLLAEGAVSGLTDGVAAGIGAGCVAVDEGDVEVVDCGTACGVALESGWVAMPPELGGASSGTEVTADDGAASATGMSEGCCTCAGSRIFWPAVMV